MNLNIFVHFLTLYQIAIIIKFINAYVLFAANLEDFRSIAKKFVPEKLADQLVDMASVKHKQKRTRDYDDIEESEESERDSLKEKKPYYAHKAATAKKNIDRYQTPNINIDELVEMVKERLADDYKNILSENKDKKLRNKQKTVRYDSETQINYPKREENDKNTEIYEMDDTGNTQNVDYEDNTQRGLKYQKHPNIKTTEYIEKDLATKNNKHEKDTDQLFDQIDLLKSNDSYEDYEIPKKEEAFESVETSVIKNEETKQSEYSQVPKNKVPGNVIPYVNNWSPKPEYDDKDEMKARTESLFYEEAVKASAPIDGAVRNKMKPKGTMIPTREHYKMSSPNYYAKLPVVAERYNFDEPLPEKDREPENLKHIGNPPASINRKIKLK